MPRRRTLRPSASDDRNELHGARFLEHYRRRQVLERCLSQPRCRLRARDGVRIAAVDDRGGAPDGDDARSPPPQPHRDGASGSARGERRSGRRDAATPSPPAPTRRQSVKPRRTPTARSGAAWPQPRCSTKSPPVCPPDHFLRIANSSGNAGPGITATTGRSPALRSWANSGGAVWAWSTRPSRSRWATAWP